MEAVAVAFYRLKEARTADQGYRRVVRLAAAAAFLRQLERTLADNSWMWRHRPASRRSYWSEICGKSGLCQPVYRSEVAFTDGGGRSQRFHTRWVEQFKPGKEVTVEYFIGRASQARIRNTADMTGWIWMVLSGLCGLGFPAIIGCTVVACQELHTLWKKRALASRPSRGSVLGYLAMSALALLAETTLALYLYWY